MATYANDVLVETEWLAEHAKDPNVRVFEVDVDTSAYEEGHVAGAVGLNWKTDLQQQPVRDLLDKRQLEGLLSKNGVTPTTAIIAYGHNDVKLVNGGRAKWIAEKRPLANDAPTYPKSEYRAGTPDASIRALRDN